MHTPNEFDGSSRHLSSQDLARGVEVSELSLHDVSVGHLQELLRMVRIWRQRSGTPAGFRSVSVA